MDKISLSIVLPAYNEAENLDPLLREILDYMEMNGSDFEIIVVDDGSGDNTKEVLAGFSGNANVKVISHEANRGYGGALKSGFSASVKEWVFFMDSDRQFNIREIEKLVSNSDNFDFVLGYRANRKDPAGRIFNAWLYRLAIRLLFGLNVRDIDCAFKLMRRNILQKIILESNGAFVSSELLIKAKRLHARFKEIPVSHYPRPAGNPTGANIGVVLKAMRDVIKFRLGIKIN